MRQLYAAALLILLALGTPVHAAETPYAGQQTCALKALSNEELADYLEGRGMGLSKVAELNHYPGPKHVLDEADQLGLSAEQLARTRSIWEAMDAKARALGERIVAQETMLEALYAKGSATQEQTRAIIDELARLQADLRYTHLSAHLAMRSVLSASQIAKYDELRGYAGAAAAPADHSRMHH